jgi:hypothetical protein
MMSTSFSVMALPMSTTNLMGITLYCLHAAPVPEGVEKVALSGIGAFNPTMGEFILNHADVQ